MHFLRALFRGREGTSEEGVSGVPLSDSLLISLIVVYDVPPSDSNLILAIVVAILLLKKIGVFIKRRLD